MKLLVALLAAVAWAQPPAVRVLVAYHSDTGNTAKLADAVRAGAASVSGVSVVAKKAADIKAEEAAAFDGIVFGAPVHWQSIPPDAKRFLDTLANLLQKSKPPMDGRTAGVFVTAGAVSSGKDLARLSVIAEFLAMKYTIVGGIDADGYGTLGPQATTGPGAPGVNQAALDEARAFGERFARLTKQHHDGSVKR